MKHEFSKSECHEWLKNKNVNPLTKRPITSEGKIYKSFEKQCNILESPKNSVRQRIRDVLQTVASSYELKEDVARRNAFAKAAALIMNKDNNGRYLVSLSEPTKTKGVGEAIGKIIMNTQLQNGSNYQFRMRVKRILNEFAIAYKNKRDMARSDAFKEAGRLLVLKDMNGKYVIDLDESTGHTISQVVNNAKV